LLEYQLQKAAGNEKSEVHLCRSSGLHHDKQSQRLANSADEDTKDWSLDDRKTARLQDLRPHT